MGDQHDQMIDTHSCARTGGGKSPEPKRSLQTTAASTRERTISAHGSVLTTAGDGKIPRRLTAPAATAVQICWEGGSRMSSLWRPA
eukprot:1088614-Prymnesium_polylepis.1